MALFSKPNVPVTALIAVSESGVQGALVHPKRNAKPPFFYKTKRYAGQKGVIGNVPELRDSLTNVLSDISDKGRDVLRRKSWMREYALDRVVYCVGSPIEYSSFVEISEEYSTPQKVSQKRIEELLEEKLSSLPESTHLFLQNGESRDNETVAVLEKDIIDIKLNGYPTDNIEGKEVRFIEARAFSSVAPDALLKDLKQYAKKKLRVSNVTYVSDTHVTMTALDLLSKQDMYSFISVGMYQSILVTVRAGRVAQVSTISHGYRDLIERVAQAFDVPISVASSYASLYILNEAETDFSQEIEKVLYDALEAWESAYEQIADTGIDTLYISSDRDIELFFKTVLERKHYSGLVTPLRNVYEEATGISTGDDDLGLAMKAHFLNTIHTW